MKMATYVTPQSASTGLLGYLSLLTLCFLLVEVSFAIHFNSIYFSDYHEVAGHFAFPKRILLPSIGYFIFAQFVIHAAFTLGVWGLARLVGRVVCDSWHKVQQLGFYFWGAGLALVLLMNQVTVQNSKFALLTAMLIPSFVANALLIVLLIAFAIAIGIAIYALLKKSIRYTGFILLLGGLLLLLPTKNRPLNDAGTPVKPNIIIIGIDALRPDFLSYFGKQPVLTPPHTPNFDDFLQHATVFSNAYTPLARTFPAWISILTGEYPKHHHVRTDLSAIQAVHLHQSLPFILQSAGYHTLFATDESRFSNIDTTYGFDQVVTPPMGVNDFLLGSINDFPLSNLIVNTAVGKWLFPYSYANRPVSVTYDPDVFVKQLDAVLNQPRHQPLFLAVHFCLPHWPYTWKDAVVHDRVADNYQAAVLRVDQQFHDFMAVLAKDALLAHTIVIVLSDHGEAIELPGDRLTEANRFNDPRHLPPLFYPPSLEQEAFNQSAGHGTDVLSFSQYHVLLAMRFFGVRSAYPQGVMSSRVSLLDIKPSLLALLALPSHFDDGHVLAMHANSAHLFIESDFSPTAIHSVHPEISRILLEGMQYFTVQPTTGRVVVKKSMLGMMFASKQYADIYSNWILALYPQSKKRIKPILLNLKTGVWTDNLRSPFASHSPLQKMLHALHAFYGSDIEQFKWVSIN